ncbi:MAG: hypothetical protein O2800_06640 [Planctomycetota bacterium]|nr:hypothetical protein [Planctomycetota bacterium]
MSHLRSLSVVGLAVACASTIAVADFTTTYNDSVNDLFDNGLSNLDIESVTIHQNDAAGGWNLSMSITTRGFADWTKYLVFIGGLGDGVSTNPWNRPIDFNNQSISGFIGAWADGGGGNQAWTVSGGSWINDGSTSQSFSSETRTMELGLGFVGFGDVGLNFSFDVATSGGGNDPGVDHLSRSDLATSGWGSGSTAGTFLNYTVIPGPGAVAVLGLIGLAGKRRRS